MLIDLIYKRKEIIYKINSLSVPAVMDADELRENKAILIDLEFQLQSINQKIRSLQWITTI